MSRKMLIDAAQSEEVRIAIVNQSSVEGYDVEYNSWKPLKGNIYLAKITRVEPSLQAAFVDYGGGRHGFIAFGEIHPDYYRIPVADLEAIKAEAKTVAREEAQKEDVINHSDEDSSEDDADEDDAHSNDDDHHQDERSEPIWRKSRIWRRYKIQEVVKRGQVLLIQVTKEERGNKGAAVTTYLSLAGRYCVLMPNTIRDGGISRKISNTADRRRLKSIVSDLNTPDGMAVIVRTAGAEKSKLEIKRDYEYLARMWDRIRQTTLDSIAPSLINEEADLIRRSIRDGYDRTIDEIIIQGEEGYKIARSFIKELIPSHVRKVKKYSSEENNQTPLFHKFGVEMQLVGVYSPQVNLPSGGYLVIHQTEALVSIDVNSGKSTKERHIEETALRTNLEAAEELCKQMQLRDLAGLLVIDFIDMEDNRHNQQVERRIKELIKHDRARIQVGRISMLGLFEMSRQRLRPNLAEAMAHRCPNCMGLGYIPAPGITAMTVLRLIEVQGSNEFVKRIEVSLPNQLTLYMLNTKRKEIIALETRHDIIINIIPSTVTEGDINTLSESIGSGWLVISYGENGDPISSVDLMRTESLKKDGQSSRGGEGRSSRRRSRKGARDQNGRDQNGRDQNNREQGERNNNHQHNNSNDNNSTNNDDSAENSSGDDTPEQNQEQGQNQKQNQGQSKRNRRPRRGRDRKNRNDYKENSEASEEQRIEDSALEANNQDASVAIEHSQNEDAQSKNEDAQQSTNAKVTADSNTAKKGGQRRPQRKRYKPVSNDGDEGSSASANVETHVSEVFASESGAPEAAIEASDVSVKAVKKSRSKKATTKKASTKKSTAKKSAAKKANDKPAADVAPAPQDSSAGGSDDRSSDAANPAPENADTSESKPKRRGWWRRG